MGRIEILFLIMTIGAFLGAYLVYRHDQKSAKKDGDKKQKNS